MRFLSAFVLAGAWLCAQTPSATVVGRVTDATGAVIPNAQVQIVNLDTNIQQQATSNAAGEYTAPYIQPGRYSLEAKAEGFRVYRRPELTLAIDQSIRIDIELQVGATTESITVEASVPVLNTENGSRGDVTTTAEINEMPLAGRNFSRSRVCSPAASFPKAKTATAAFAINGARADNTGFLLDGMNNTQRRNTGSMVSPPLEGVQEFKMITSGFAAEHGRYAGGVLSVVLKSGGNRFRGSRSTSTSAMTSSMRRNFFDLEKSKLRRNQFGATASGPVILPKLYNGRNRTFFLASWESLRQIIRRQDARGNRASARDAEGRLLPCNGCERQAAHPHRHHDTPAVPRQSDSRVAVRSGRSEYGVVFTRQPNLNDPLNNYISQANSTSNWDNFTVKIDHNLSDRDQLSGRVLWRPTKSSDPFTRSIIPGFGTTSNNFELLSGLRYTRTLTPMVIMEFNASFSRKTINQGFPGNDQTDWAGLYGFHGGTTQSRRGGTAAIGHHGLHQHRPRLRLSEDLGVQQLSVPRVR